MEGVTYKWKSGDQMHAFDLVFVRGTHGRPFPFGQTTSTRFVHIEDFFIGRVPVTQALWTHVMGHDNNPSAHRGPDLPLENISWHEITRPGGFLDRINNTPLGVSIRGQIETNVARFRLPSEAEWEYAARGGPAWSDGFGFSGSDNIDAVAWYDRRHGDHTQPVALKAPNQLGIHDMSGNIWEWCQDVFTRDVISIPDDGSPFLGPGDERVLRGGCFHNWAIHCTVSKRYEIGSGHRDGCIGFRLAISACASKLRVIKPDQT